MVLRIIHVTKFSIFEKSIHKSPKWTRSSQNPCLWFFILSLIYSQLTPQGFLSFFVIGLIFRSGIFMVIWNELYQPTYGEIHDMLYEFISLNIVSTLWLFGMDFARMVCHFFMCWLQLWLVSCANLENSWPKVIGG